MKNKENEKGSSKSVLLEKEKAVTKTVPTGTNKREEIQNLKLETIPLAEEQGLQLYNKPTGFKAIYNPDTKAVYTVTSDSYQLIQHRDVWNAIAKLAKFKVGDTALYKGGGVMVIELLPKTPIKEELIVGTKDFFEPRVRIINSYDTSKALSIQAYGMRLVCTNGMIAPGFVNRFKQAHTFQNIDIETLGDKIELAMNSWTATRDQIKQASTKRVNIEYAIHSVGKFPKKYADEVRKLLKPKLDTIYNVWNAFTNVLSHQMKENVQTGTLIKYQQRANKVFTLLNDPQAEEDWNPTQIPPTEVVDTPKKETTPEKKAAPAKKATPPKKATSPKASTSTKAKTPTKAKTLTKTPGKEKTEEDGTSQGVKA